MCGCPWFNVTRHRRAGHLWWALWTGQGGSPWVRKVLILFLCILLKAFSFCSSLWKETSFALTVITNSSLSHRASHETAPSLPHNWHPHTQMSKPWMLLVMSVVLLFYWYFLHTNEKVLNILVFFGGEDTTCSGDAQIPVSVLRT